MDVNSAIDTVAYYANEAKENFLSNMHKFLEMNAKQWIRIITIVGAYILLRPYIMKFVEMTQSKDLAKPIQEQEKGPTAAISPNSLRGQVEVPEDSDDEEEEEEAQASGANWGKKARKRQRAVLRRIFEADEKLRREQQWDENEDKDIEPYLIG
jgi:hypothetical protein